MNIDEQDDRGRLRKTINELESGSNLHKNTLSAVPKSASWALAIKSLTSNVSTARKCGRHAKGTNRPHPLVLRGSLHYCLSILSCLCNSVQNAGVFCETIVVRFQKQPGELRRNGESVKERQTRS